MTAVYSKKNLLSLLPLLPAPSKKKISSSVEYGITASSSSTRNNRFVLVDLSFGGPWTQSFVPDRKVDLRKKNASKRKIMVLTESKKGFMKSLNTSLAGGEDYPVLTGILSIFTGVISGGAGVLFTLTTTAISASKNPQPVLAREGDEIWQLERVGKAGGDIMHVEYFFLVDPFRKADGKVGAAWIIHETRRELDV